jgi:putative oxidoreductase
MATTSFRSDLNTSTRLNFVLLLLRLSLAVIFIYHGLAKITGPFGGADWVTDMYGRRPELQVPTTLTFTGTQLAVAWGELIGGAALLIGLLTRLSALGMIIIQTGAIVLVTGARGFSAETGGVGYEYNIALLTMCVSLLILGAGGWSVDWIETPRRRRVAAQVAAEEPTPPRVEPQAAPATQPAEPATPAM